MATPEDMIQKMYESSLAAKKEQLGTQNSIAQSNLDAQQQQNARDTAAALSSARANAQRDTVSNTQLRTAAGLTSGAAARARLSDDTAHRADLTAIRLAAQQADADLERQRSVLSQEFAAAIRQAQADSDLEKAQALYQRAADAESKLYDRQLSAAKIMAENGDYTRLAQIYGLTEDEVRALAGLPPVTKGNGGAPAPVDKKPAPNLSYVSRY